ncbi:hypothetical protein T492DRAFT_896347 [Pavlovales sp. CCMP2436]|nr:hypothetical protein T492DRAFT_896347 [Pavlovales sp. CCMP2436]
MLAGVNDADADAHALGALLAGRPVVVNLIPYNPTDATPEFLRSSEERTDSFLKILYEGHGLKTFVRRTMGTEVASACGQLVKGVQRPAQPQQAAAGVRDIEDALGGSAGGSAQKLRPRPRAAPAATAAAAAAVHSDGPNARTPEKGKQAAADEPGLWLRLRARLQGLALASEPRALVFAGALGVAVAGASLTRAL